MNTFTVRVGNQANLYDAAAMTALKRIRLHTIECLGMWVLSLGGWGMLLSAGSAVSAEDNGKAQRAFVDRAFDSDWRFLRGDVPKAQRPQFDDSSWRLLDLSQDWSIADLLWMSQGRRTTNSPLRTSEPTI